MAQPKHKLEDGTIGGDGGHKLLALGSHWGGAPIYRGLDDLQAAAWLSGEQFPSFMPAHPLHQTMPSILTVIAVTLPGAPREAASLDLLLENGWVATVSGDDTGWRPGVRAMAFPLGFGLTVPGSSEVGHALTFSGNRLPMTGDAFDLDGPDTADVAVIPVTVSDRDDGAGGGPVLRATAPAGAEWDWTVPVGAEWDAGSLVSGDGLPDLRDVPISIARKAIEHRRWRRRLAPHPIMPADLNRAVLAWQTRALLAD